MRRLLSVNLSVPDGIRVAALCGVLLLVASGAARAQVAAGDFTYPVGIRQVEFVDGERHLALAIFYPAVIDEYRARPFVMPFFANLQLYQGADRPWAMPGGRW
jgi:hypothetical protein